MHWRHAKIFGVSARNGGNKACWVMSTKKIGLEDCCDRLGIVMLVVMITLCERGKDGRAAGCENFSFFPESRI